MQNNETSPIASQTFEQRSNRERIGLAIYGADAAAAAKAIVAAEAADVRQVWMTQFTSAPDTMAIFAAASLQTSRVRMGTAIVPTYPRHPISLAQQALTLGDLAPNRLRLGIGTSHRPAIEGFYGIPMSAPLEHLREYVDILRAILWQGEVDYHGRFFNVKTTFPRTPRTPILISALRTGAFHLAGEVSDGAISWVCPVQYLLEKALPALRSGAAKGGRPVPPLVAGIPVALSQDRKAVQAAARCQLSRYERLPFYANMFADAGFPIAPDGTMTDALIDSLVVYGDEAAIATRFAELLEAGLDELLVMNVQIADPDIEQVRLSRLIGQI
ncbi:MAG: LLM class flavin-dependent oxidoreductase [Ktedonobacteraceae bacterium]